jgi:NAD(P)-dependent dehydrogenase (short-subunit alcohol dehydrogenase family)
LNIAVLPILFLIIGLIFHKLKNFRKKKGTHMNRTVVITGANRGIGLELASHFHKQGDKIIAIVRQSSDELAAIADTVIENVELTNAEHIETLKQQLSGFRVDILINNAGMWHDDQLGQFNFDELSEQMNVNAFAPMRVIEALLANFSEGSKIANITSRMGSIADNDSGGRYGYRASKAALNALTKSLSIDLKPKGIAACVLHPGWVQTRMVNFSGLITPQEAAQGLAARIEALNLENTGGFWHSNGEELPW